VFVEESTLTIDDGYFACEGPSSIVWQNSPTVRHALSGSFSFVDGHSEHWRWHQIHTEQPLNASAIGSMNDYARLQKAVFP
jgi:hypothetical protein